MERQSKGSRGLEAYCKGGQGPPRAVAPPKKKKKKKKKKEEEEEKEEESVACGVKT
jgi:ribosomal protein L12E/L44/L45/RPP1/RPP2